MKILLAIFLAVLGLAMFSGSVLLQRKWLEPPVERVQVTTPEAEPEAPPVENEVLVGTFQKHQ
jgi:hypothetical protein